MVYIRLVNAWSGWETRRVSGGGVYFDAAYFAWQAERALRSARAVVPLLLELVSPRSVVDVGSGPGAWLQAFVEQGVDDVLAVDNAAIADDQLRVVPAQFVSADLADLPRLDRRFDLAISLEAAHYAPEQAAPGIVETLTAYAPVVYFGAAIPNQGGGPGLNRQWPRYWSDLFAARAYRCVDVLRTKLWEHPDVDWWYAQNGLLYVADETPGLAGTGTPLPLVHPKLFTEVATAPVSAPAPTVVKRWRLGLRR
jgi:SAM-dependent methyltransferase